MASNDQIDSLEKANLKIASLEKELKAIRSWSTQTIDLAMMGFAFSEISHNLLNRLRSIDFALEFLVVQSRVSTGDRRRLERAQSMINQVFNEFKECYELGGRDIRNQSPEHADLIQLLHAIVINLNVSEKNFRFDSGTNAIAVVTGDTLQIQNMLFIVIRKIVMMLPREAKLIIRIDSKLEHDRGLVDAWFIELSTIPKETINFDRFKVQGFGPRRDLGLLWVDSFLKLHGGEITSSIENSLIITIPKLFQAS